MTLSELKNKSNNLVITDRDLIDKAVNQMLWIPVDCLYKADLTIQKESLNHYELKDIYNMINAENYEVLMQRQRFKELIQAIDNANLYFKKMHIIMKYLSELSIGFILKGHEPKGELK